MLSKTIRDISSLKIQGATNIALAAVTAVDSLSKKKFPSREAFDRELKLGLVALSMARSTEPALRNSLHTISTLPSGSLSSAQRALHRNVVQLLKKQKATKAKTAENVTSIIEDGDIIFTHCHSSTVTAGLKLAKKKGRRFSVICTETRPRYQGRITARELDAAHIPVTFIVDSATSLFLDQSTKVLIGCDSIEWRGSILNKVGTFSLALLAKHFSIPFFCVTESYKFSPETRSKEEQIEYRSPKEIWNDKIHTLNPAFDRTPPKYLTAIITEFGVLTPKKLLPKLRKMYKL